MELTCPDSLRRSWGGWAAACPWDAGASASGCSASTPASDGAVPTILYSQSLVQLCQLACITEDVFLSDQLVGKSPCKLDLSSKS